MTGATSLVVHRKSTDISRQTSLGSQWYSPTTLPWGVSISPVPPIHRIILPDSTSLVYTRFLAPRHQKILYPCPLLSSPDICARSSPSLVSTHDRDLFTSRIGGYWHYAGSGPSWSRCLHTTKKTELSILLALAKGRRGIP